MTPIGQIERKTQDRVVALLQGRLGYADLGNPAQQAKAATKRPDVVLYVNGIALALLSLPCVLGFNVWAGVEVPGIGNIQAIEDFLMSNNVLPLGALVFLLFCTSKRGWGWDAFLREADTGEGTRFPRWARGYVRFALPVLILAVFVAGYVPIVQTWLGLG